MDTPAGGAAVTLHLSVLIIMLSVAINCSFVDFMSVYINNVSFFYTVVSIGNLWYSLHLLLFLQKTPARKSHSCYVAMLPWPVTRRLGWCICWRLDVCWLRNTGVCPGPHANWVVCLSLLLPILCRCDVTDHPVVTLGIKVPGKLLFQVVKVSKNFLGSKNSREQKFRKCRGTKSP